MKEIEYIQVDVRRFLDAHAQGFDLAVELGAGRFEKLAHLDATERVGVEIYKPYIDHYQPERRGIRAVHDDMLRYKHEPRDGRRDVLLLIDSIEHLAKKDGMRLLKRLMPKFSRVVVITPSVWVAQDKDGWGMGNDYHQTHKSMWSADDLGALGFTVEDNINLHFAVWNRDS